MKSDLSFVKKGGRWVQLLLTLLTAVSTAVVFGWVLIPNFISWQISKRVVISPDINPELYSAWVEPPFPIYLKVYLFNCTNPSDVEKGALPAFQERGPYTFLEKRKKVNVILDDPSDTATYKEHISYHFDKQLSRSDLSMEDVITFINVPFAGAAIKIDRDFPWPLSHVGQMILVNYKEPLFVQRTVEEIMFKGWRVPFLDKIEEELGLTLLENNTFALFVGHNDTAQGPYTIRRGRHGDKSLYGTMVRYKNESTLDFWGADRQNYCNQLYGSDGSLYPPFIGKEMKLKLFNAEICRSAYLVYSEEVDMDGIRGYRFAPGRLRGQALEDEKCFCLEENRDNCLKYGANDMGPCRDGAPVAISNPHFYGAGVDPGFKGMIEGGWQSEKGEHETYIDVEPLTGAVIRASKKLQVNLMLKPVKSIKSMRKVRELLFPIFWADECASLDDKVAERIKTILFQIHTVEYSSKVVAILVASLVPILIIAVSITRQRRLKKTYADSLAQKDEPLSSRMLIDEK